ncbi:hypothetical protein FW774_18185 [Pedobacter sp. BS3]|uniref:sugar-binding domain-containing protein n=1 Tax=Pedobacter sp. BS3 TaxID=2567937 RepID=UPI0011EFB723|nr:sugar-binding domain-containing protein [Pedobacter sp. BS3]TZF81488.1 hypothetical protein FW774_18185 [Pedobacter sp. BS3]
MTTRRNFIKNTTLGSAWLMLPACRLFRNFTSGTTTTTSQLLAGDWYFRLDPENKGIEQEWYKTRFAGTAKLPGSIQAQGYGNEVTAETEWWDGKLKGVWKTSPVYEKYRQPGNVKNYEFLQPEKHYLGAVWYSKEFIIPENWKNKRVTLLLERVHWESTVYINGKRAGSQNYLGTAHHYDITGFLSEGKNTIAIRVDNSRKIDVGDMPHSISEQTQGTWNGIVGRIALSITDKVWIDDMQVYPDIENRKISVALTMGSLLKNDATGILELTVTGAGEKLPAVSKAITVSANGYYLQVDYPLEDNISLWDEHHPVLYTLNARFKGKSGSDNYSDTETVQFGMRKVTVKGTQVSVNNKVVHFRGNVDCAIFPVNGYPEMDATWWKNLWKRYKDWGMNLVRFHSWCPPEAAFAAADEVGIYLQPECSEWASDNTAVQLNFLIEESKAILKRYGNHPSFIMMALGNEKSIKKEYLESLFTIWKKDKRRLYTGKTGGKPLLDAADYYVGGASKKGTRARYYLGWPPRPEPSYFYQFQPATTRDYIQAVKDDSRPFISHEIAQRCAYPDVINLPKKFTGSLQPTYLDIARDQLEERGMLHQVPDFVNASGKWQVELYKEEIEANLRTSGIGGFHLLSLQDFPGQGTAPVGFMDFFYDAKPYVTSGRVIKFCNSLVILARIKKRTWFTNEHFEADVDLYNFSGKPFKPAKTTCIIKSADGKTVYQKEFDPEIYADEGIRPVGNITASLASFSVPAKYTLEISMDAVVNDWDFWVYPQYLPSIDTPDILIAKTFDEEVKTALDKGKTVLLLPEREHLKGKLVQCFGTFYWTAFDFHGGETSACGLLTNPEHPVFKYFPTDFHGNWQWWELLVKASPMILDDFEAKNPFPKDFKPLIQMIPSWKVNRKLSVLTEVKAGNGKLMLCSMDITTDLDNRKVAAQFRYSLLNYLLSEDFDPGTMVSYDIIREIFI